MYSVYTLICFYFNVVNINYITYNLRILVIDHKFNEDLSLVKEFLVDENVDGSRDKIEIAGNDSVRATPVAGTSFLI